MLKLIVAAAAFALCVAPSAAAQQTPSAPAAQAAPQVNVDPAALAAARRLMTAGHVTEGMNAMVQAMMPQMIQAIGHAQGLTPSQTELVSRVVREEMVAGTPQLMDMMAQLYATHLSAADINAAADFYETDAGKHFIAVQGQMSAEGVAIGRAWGQQMTPRVLARLEQEMRTPGGTQP